MTDRFEGLTDVRVADVYKSGQLAATLTRGDDGVDFAYLPDYLAGHGRAVSTTLPLTGEAVHTTAGAVPPFFAGLLPEGRRLSSLRRAVKASADDEFALLLAVGSDVVGDVQVEPGGQAPLRPAPLAQVSKEWSEIRFGDVLESAGVVDPVGLAGMQDKVSARMISVPVSRTGERFILKVDPPEYPHIVENEAFFVGRAKRANLDVVSASLVRDATGRPGLLVRRFDRVADGRGNTEFRACEDACQVLGRWPADKYNVSAERAVVALADHCAARPVALRALYRQVCFAWLTGNGDLHAKNMSILATDDGEWRVSPAYDLPSTAAYGDTSMALSIDGRRRGLSRKRLLAFAGAVGLPERAATADLDEITERLDGVEQLISDGALPFPIKTNVDLAKELRHRRRLALG